MSYSLSNHRKRSSYTAFKVQLVSNFRGPAPQKGKERKVRGKKKEKYLYRVLFLGNEETISDA